MGLSSYGEGQNKESKLDHAFTGCPVSLQLHIFINLFYKTQICELVVKGWTDPKPKQFCMGAFVCTLTLTLMKDWTVVKQTSMLSCLSIIASHSQKTAIKTFTSPLSLNSLKAVSRYLFVLSIAFFKIRCSCSYKRNNLHQKLFS